MAQTMYAHMNELIEKKKERQPTEWEKIFTVVTG
jgi:hypothetical protein